MKHPTKPRRRRKRPPSRIAKRQVAGFFAPAISRGLKLLAAETDTTVQALIAEALRDLFSKRGKHQLAEALRTAETTEGHEDFSTGVISEDGTVSLRALVTEELSQKLRARAAKERRSVSSMIELFLERAVEEEWAGIDASFPERFPESKFGKKS